MYEGTVCLCQLNLPLPKKSWYANSGARDFIGALNIKMFYVNKQLLQLILSYIFQGFPEAGNYGLRTTAFGIFFMREHNRIAEALYKINPCWKDDRLFKVARQINIATASNIFMYELLPLLLSKLN